MKTKLRLYMALALLLLPACNFVTSIVGGGGLGGGNSGGSSGGQQIQTLMNTPASPLSLALDLDQAHKTQALITPAGGQLSTKGADGTIYTLEIPKGALPAETTIIMTPIGKVTGLPGAATQTHAVQLEPNGLYFFQDATLSITPAKPVPLDKQVLFDFENEGKTVGLALPFLGTKDIKLRLIHFSGYGVSDGGPAATQGVLTQSGGEAGLQSQAAALLQQMRLDQQAGRPTDQSLIDAFNNLVDQWDEQVVKPALEAAGDSCASAKEAIRRAIDAERLRQIVGLPGGLKTDIVDLIVKGSKTCVESEYTHCAGQHIINGMIPLWLGLRRLSQIVVGGALEPVVKLAETLTVKCLTFELRFHSQGLFIDGDAGYDSTVDAKVRLQFDPQSFTIKGSGPLDNQTFNFRIPPPDRHTSYTIDTTTGGGTFEVKGLTYKEDKHSENDSEFYISDFNLLYFPGVTSERYHIHTVVTHNDGKVDISDFTSQPSAYWTGTFFMTHHTELNAASGDPNSVPAMPDLSSMMGGGLQFGAMPALPAPAMPADGGFVADKWSVTVGDLLGSKDWTHSDAASGVTEAGTLQLYHRPGQ